MEKILTTEDATPTPAAEVKSIFTLTVLSDWNIKVDASSNEVRMDAIPDAAIKWYLFNVYNQYKEMFRKEAGLDEDKFRLTEEQVNKIRQVTYFVTKAQLFDAFHKVTGQYDEQEFNNIGSQDGTRSF